MEFELEKISFDDFIQEYSVNNICSLKIYLKEVWKFYDLPGLLCDRLFKIFDSDKNNFLNKEEFLQGMLSIFSLDYNKLTVLIFKVYDFQNTGLVSREDIRTILSHISIKTDTNDSDCPKFKYDRETFKDRLESQEELHSLLDKLFRYENKIDFARFIHLIENVDSNIFLYLLIFLLQKRPFTNKTLENYNFIKSRTNHSFNPQILTSSPVPQRTAKSPTNLTSNNKKIIASPTLLNKLAPSESISRSPTFQKKKLNMELYKEISDSFRFLTSYNQENAKIGIYQNNSIIETAILTCLKNSDIKEFSNSNTQHDRAGDEDYNSQNELIEEYAEIRNIPISKNIKKSFIELNARKNISLHHFSIQDDHLNTARSFSSFDESDVSSSLSNMGQLEYENSNKNDDFCNTNPQEKEICLISESIIDKKTNNSTVQKNKYLNFENLLKTSRALSNRSSGCNSVNSSSPNSTRSVKLDDNYLYPSKKYENDINYVNRSTFKTSIAHKNKSINHKSGQHNKNSNKNITLKIPEKIEIRKSSFQDNSNSYENLTLENNLEKKENSKIMNNLNTDLDKTNLSNPSIKTRDNMSEKSEIIIDDTLDQSSKENKIYREVYKTNSDEVHKGMHNITGVLVKEEKKIEHEGRDLFCFSLIYPFKVRKYYIESLEEYQKWVNDLKKVIGYENLEDQYELKEDLGKGNFGLVKLAIHKGTGRKVAIKIIGKKNINHSDLEIIKNEIEILKLCQHPNIIKLFDVFENSDFIYIITEYLEGGNLLNYLKKRSFKLSEKRVAHLVHQICTAVYYLNSYGIIHRDLKPENLVMTDDTEEAKVKILDFGLSKIIGPNEECHEPYGTIGYCAPEILLDQFYGKKVDSWSIGVITYFLLCGYLPFDHETSIKEIAKKTVHQKTPFPNKEWKDLSVESRNFVDGLLCKSSDNRTSISEALENIWFRKHISNKLIEIRNLKNKSNNFVFHIYTTPDANKIDA